MHVAVAGNPNAGKTTLFNALTGARAHVANYPGVTVEQRVATLQLAGGEQLHITDLPGCYSLVARSPEEQVAHEVLVGRLGRGRPDRIICVVDATQLGRGLYLVQQLLELEMPMVVALNMMDVAEARGIEIDLAALEKRLGVPVIPTDARARRGLDHLLQRLREAPNPIAVRHEDLGPRAEACIEQVQAALHEAGQPGTRGEALWWLTSDLSELKRSVGGVAPSVFNVVARAREQLNSGTGDPEAEDFNRQLITLRYRRIDEHLQGLITTTRGGKPDLTERIDRVLLHRRWGLAIFAVAMFLLFQAVFAWAEPMIAGVEWLMGALASLLEGGLPQGLVRSLLINGVLAGVGNILVFLPQIALLFFGITLMEESGYMARAAVLLDSLMRRVGLHGKSFVPLMSSFACAVPGVMAARTVESARDRLVTMMVAPFMSCSARLPVYTLVVAAVFSTAAPFYGLSIGGLVMVAMYLLGFVAAIATAALLKRSVLRGATPALLIELPSYRLPLPREVLRRVVDRCRVFVTQTGTIILAISLLLWGMLTFPQQGLPAHELQARQGEIAQLSDPGERGTALAELQQLDRSTQLRNSVGGRIGRAIEPIIAPLGFDWRIGIGLVASFAAREVLVSTLGQVYALDADVEPDSPALRDALLADKDPRTGQPRFTPLVGLSLMVFFVLAMQCMSTFATVRRETNSWRWPLAQLMYMNTLAFFASLLTYQVGTALGLG